MADETVCGGEPGAWASAVVARHSAPAAQTAVIQDPILFMVLLLALMGQSTKPGPNYYMLPVTTLLRLDNSRCCGSGHGRAGNSHAALSSPFLVAALALGGCASLPPLEGRTPSTALTETADTTLGKAVSAENRDREGRERNLRAPAGQGRFAARVVLARAAERSLDVQYYIWHADVTGFLLLGELWDAAERGVRVRMLLDDNGIKGLDPILAVFDATPTSRFASTTRMRTAASRRSATSPISIG